jgi:hypothetical protein
LKTILPNAFVFLAFAMLTISFAQVVVEEDIVTDSVDVFYAENSVKTLSPVLIMGQTLLLPGLGHQAIGQHNRALTYFSADLLFLLGAFFSQDQSAKLFDDAQSYAWKYAGVQGGSGANKTFWQRVGATNESEGYNAIQENERHPQDKIYQPHLQWHWDDESFRLDYLQIRETATRYRVVASFCVGAMVLNRLVSFIDIRNSTRHRGVRSKISTNISPQISPDLTSFGLTISNSF